MDRSINSYIYIYIENNRRKRRFIYIDRKILPMAKIEITFLGTSAMVPTKDRNVQGIYLNYGGEGILIDCGEGTQRQMAIAGINRAKVKIILISHWHGDHVSGLVGLIQTIGNINDHSKIELYGPVGTRTRMKHMMESCIFYNKVNIMIHEINPKKLTKFYENKFYELYAAPLEHSVPCIGFKFLEKEKRKIEISKVKRLGLKEGPDLGKLQEGTSIIKNGKKINPDDVSSMVKGKSIAFILDTALCGNCKTLAEDVDLLVSECVYAGDLEEKAEQYKHLTAKQIAQIASEVNVKKLILTHFSQRYKEVSQVLQDARDIFNNTETAFDFMKTKVE